MPYELYELDVRVREIEPSIWRTVEVPGAWSLEEVHFALQVAMGWTNSHLHQFIIAKAAYGMVDVDDTGDLEMEDERLFRLQDLVRSGDSFRYAYDFGDSWEHDVRVSKVTSVVKLPKARCIAGARACPPEDCGGVGGYEHLLAVLADPRHEEHAEMVQWSGDFAPEVFSLPKGGLDLGPAIKRYKELANEDEDLDDAAGLDAASTSPATARSRARATSHRARCPRCCDRRVACGRAGRVASRRRWPRRLVVSTAQEEEARSQSWKARSVVTSRASASGVVMAP
jgi:hypothetical protein